MTTLNCPHCNQQIELSQALTQDIERRVVNAEHEKHRAEIERVRAETAQKAAVEAAAKLDLQMQQTKDQAETEKREKQLLQEQLLKLGDELRNSRQAAEKTVRSEFELNLRSLQQEAEADKAQNKQLRDQLSQLMTELREERRAKENAELAAQQKLAAEEGKIRESAAREADERQRLNLAAKEKTITDLQKALDDAQRKAAQGSQQLQGEILELDLETALAEAFRDDNVEPVAKGTRGGDIMHTVRSPRGTHSGIMIWEFKRTKNWTDSWISKLKEDVRAAKASVAIIVSEVMPKGVAEDIGHVDGVWVCKPQLAIMLGTLLRKSLLDVTRQKALDQNRTTNAEALYNFVTSHEFVQQIEHMVETYREMTEQVTKERVAFEKLWAQREKQAQRLMLSTAGIIGSMQGHIGATSMPRIKGLELLEADLDH